MNVHEECPRCGELTECELTGDEVRKGQFIQKFRCIVCNLHFTKSVSIITDRSQKPKKRHWWN